jgi:NitT/TauT family transport system permease protein
MINRRPNSTLFAAQIQTPLSVQALTLVIVIALWELIGRTGILFDELFPPMLEILQSLSRFVTTPLLLPHLKASLYEVGGALVLAMLTAIPLGILWGSRRSWLEIVEPLILYAAVVPKIVIFPVFILFLGIDVHSKLAVGAIAAFFPISLLTIAGMREVKKVYVDVARTAGASALQIANHVYLPAIAGQVFTGIRLGMGAAVTGALLAETKIAKAGLGFMIVEYYGQFRIADMYSLLLFIFILAAVANWTLKFLFSIVSPLPRASGDAGMYF